MKHNVEHTIKETQEYVMTRICNCAPRTDDEGTITHAPTCPLFEVNSLTDPIPAAAKLADPPVPEHVGYDLVEPKPEAVELCARIVHEAVCAMNRSMNEVNLPWEVVAPSVMAGIQRVLVNPFETDEENHAAWMDLKLKEGWVFGPNKDATVKTHPCLVPYEQLGPFARSKDSVFSAIVRTFFGLPSTP